MRCPVCFAKVTKCKIFEVYDCPNGCHNKNKTKGVSAFFSRDDVITEKEYRQMFRRVTK